MADELNRVFLWGVPRSMSTSVIKCLSYVDGMQIVNQPYSTVHFAGEYGQQPKPNKNDQILTTVWETYEKIKEDISKSTVEIPGLDHSLMSLQLIRDKVLEVPYPNKKILLCRDQAPYLYGRYDLLPRGFKYSFLIRHPIKMFHSLKKHLIEEFGEFPDLRALPPILFPRGYCFKELYELVEYVRENIDPNPTILDADDLLQNPAGILSTYCTRMGIPYSSQLLSWEAADDISSTWIMAKTTRLAHNVLPFYKRAFDSIGFFKPTPIPNLASLPEDVQACVKVTMGYYDSLYRDRITASA